MAPPTDAERQKILLQQEIAKLSGALSRHSRHPSAPSHSSYHPYKSQPPTRAYSSSYRGRGRGGAGGRGGGAARGRGRGRGGSFASMSLDLRGQGHPTSTSGSTATPNLEDGEVAPEAGLAATATKLTATWVKPPRHTQNMSLMTLEKRAKMQAAIDQRKAQKTQKALDRAAARKAAEPVVQLLGSSSNGPQQVSVDGILFQYSSNGEKLVRVDELRPGMPDPLERHKRHIVVDGQKFKFNIKRDLVQTKSSSMRGHGACRFFTRTGCCMFALTCKGTHDPNRVAICHKFLRGDCELGNRCPLSHTSSPHNTPSCVRFQATSNCSRANCPYPHVKVSDDAFICEDFALNGWCDAEPGTCPDLHVWECPEFRAKGTCTKKKCKLRHILRAEKGRMLVTAKKEEQEAVRKGEGEVDERAGVQIAVPGGFEEQTDFVEFDQGSPGVVSEDEAGDAADESDEEESSSGEDESEDDEEEGQASGPVGKQGGSPLDSESDDDADMGLGVTI